MSQNYRDEYGRNERGGRQGMRRSDDDGRNLSARNRGWSADDRRGRDDDEEDLYRGDDDLYRGYGGGDDLGRYRDRLARARNRNYVSDSFDDDDFRAGAGYGDVEERRGAAASGRSRDVFGQSQSGGFYGGYGQSPGAQGNYGGPGGYVGGGGQGDMRRQQQANRFYGGGYGADLREQGYMAWGEHRGKGPRGYQRSDDRIREDVNDRLTDDDQLDASDIEVKVKDCEVTLSGFVQRREDRRRAEDCAEGVSGVRHVQNNIRVRAPGQQQQQQQQGAAQQQGGSRAARASQQEGDEPR